LRASAIRTGLAISGDLQVKIFLSITHCLIIVTALLWIAYDVVAFRFGGPYGVATESVTLGTWMEDYPWVAFAIAALYAHLVASGSQGLNLTRGGIIAAGLLTGYILTRLS
jgi:hypothetical protein